MKVCRCNILFFFWGGGGVLRCTQYLLPHKGGITKIFEFANFQMSFQDLKRPGREMLNNICLAGLRILSIMVIWVGVSLDL
jgi:hypothetical protein